MSFGFQHRAAVSVSRSVYVMVLPHLGSNTVETRDAMGYLVLDGIDAVLAGRAAGNLIS